MKLSAIAFAAVAAFATSRATANELRCNITDNQNNAMVYDFVDAFDDSGNIVRQPVYNGFQDFSSLVS